MLEKGWQREVKKYRIRNDIAREEEKRGEGETRIDHRIRVTLVNTYSIDIPQQLLRLSKLGPRTPCELEECCRTIKVDLPWSMCQMGNTNTYEGRSQEGGIR